MINAIELINSWAFHDELPKAVGTVVAKNNERLIQLVISLMRRYLMYICALIGSKTIIYCISNVLC